MPRLRQEVPRRHHPGLRLSALHSRPTRVAALEAVRRRLEACGSSFAIGCASGTDALWLALASAGIGDSTSGSRSGAAPDAVITSPFSFFASASAILRAGARPLFADIDPRTFNLSPDSVAELLGTPVAQHVKAVLPVHLYGQCADWDGFETLTRDYPGLALIEDAAQAFAATWTSQNRPARPAGSLGLAAAFSFYPTKNLAAAGEAGMVTTSNSELDARARSLRSHGMTRRYYHDEVGWNSRLDAIQAAILDIKLRYIPEWNQQRRDRAARYDELFHAAGLPLPCADASLRQRKASSYPSPIRAPSTSFTSTSFASRVATPCATTLRRGASAARFTIRSPFICRPP